MKKRSGILVVFLFLIICYAYSFYLALWGHPLYSGIGDAGYLVAFHLLAVVIYLTISILLGTFETQTTSIRPELIFILHGSLLTLFPYNGYQSIGAIVMAAALISSAIGSRK